MEKVSHVTSSRVISFISDRNKGLLKSVPKVFPNCFYFYCLQHLKNNLRDHLSGSFSKPVRDNLVNMFRNCAYESNQFKFHQKLYLLLKEGSDPIRKFLQTLKRENWTSSYFEGQKYGEMYSNVAESFNSWIREGRHLPIMELVDYIRGQIMKMMADRREIANRWNGCLCPEIDNRIANLLKEGRS